MDFIQSWNTDHTEELPIIVAAGSLMLCRMVFHGNGENLSELDIVCHLVSCAITQSMLDSAYPWALIWIDQHSSIHFHDCNQKLELECLEQI